MRSEMLQRFEQGKSDGSFMSKQKLLFMVVEEMCEMLLK